MSVITDVITASRRRLYAWLSARYMDGCSNYNSLAVRRGCRSKAQARQRFAERGVPHAKGMIFYNPFAARKFALEHGFPLVIKPNVSGFSRGSHFPITNMRELWKAALWVKVWWPSSVVEQYLWGANYRVLATRDDIASVIRRYPPFVDGNGEDTIAALIDTENEVRERMQLTPVIHRIEKSREVRQYLEKQQLSLQSIPGDGERIYLFNRVALAPGGVVETIDSASIPEANQKLFKQIVSDFDAHVLGIDVIFEEGIEKPWDQQRCIFLEVNSRPYMKMHNVPRFGPVPDLSAFYAKMDQLAVVDSDIF